MVKPDMALLGGTERTLLLERDALQAEGHHVDLLHAGSPSDITAGFDEVHSLPDILDRGPKFERVAVRSQYRELMARLRRKGTQVVHVHGLPRTSVMLRMAGDIALVTTGHNASCPNTSRYQWDTRQACSRPIGIGCLTVGYRSLGCGHLGDGSPLGVKGFVRGMVEDKWLRTAIARSHRVIAPSVWMAEYLAENGTSADKITVLPPPIEALPETAPLTRSAGGLPMVSFVGRLVDFKGADQLLHASARLTVPHRIVIAGGGPEREPLEELARSLGIADRVELPGQVDPVTAQQIRRESAVVVVPSLSPETYGMVGPESMAIGVPVVGYLVGGTGDWLAMGGRLARGVPVGDVARLAEALHDLLVAPPSDAERQDVIDQVHAVLSPAAHGARLLQVYAGAVESFGR